MKEYKKYIFQNGDNFLFIRPAHTKLNENAKCGQGSGASVCCLKKGGGSIDIKGSENVLDVSSQLHSRILRLF